MSVLPIYGSYVDVRSFASWDKPRTGAIEEDWQPEIQAAIDHIIQHSSGDVGTLYLPPGIYRIKLPIIIALLNGADYTFCSIQIVGDSPGYAGPNRTEIRANFSDRPAIVIQCARVVKLRNLVIRGMNTWPALLDLKTLAPLYDKDIYLVNTDMRDTRFSPYAGICIDPFYLAETSKLDPSFPGPVDHYPFMEHLYKKSGEGSMNYRAGSAWVRIEDCCIDGFVVGIGIALNGYTQNADNIVIQDCIITSTKSAIAIGQQQSRNVTVRSLTSTTAKFVFDCLSYGNGSGDCPAIFGASIGQVHSIFNTFSSGGTPSINALYAEDFLSVGQLSCSGDTDGHVFNACNFTFAGRPEGFPAPSFRLANNTHAIFNGCQFYMSTPDEPMWLINQTRLTFNECSFVSAIDGDKGLQGPSLFWINGQPERVQFNNCTMIVEPSGAILSNIMPVPDLSGVFRQVVLPGCFMYEVNGAGTALRWVASRKMSVDLNPYPDAGIEVAFNADGTATFTAPNVNIIQVGDFIHSNLPYTPLRGQASGTDILLVIGKVTSVEVSTGVVTLDYVPEVVTLHELHLLTLPPADPPQPRTHRLSIVYYPRAHWPETGTLTVPSMTDDGKTITVLQSPLNPAEPSATWKVGDRIYAGNGGITPGTYVVSVGSANTITLSTPVTAAGSNVRLFDADIREMVTTKV